MKWTARLNPVDLTHLEWTLIRDTYEVGHVLSFNHTCLYFVYLPGAVPDSPLFRDIRQAAAYLIGATKNV